MRVGGFGDDKLVQYFAQAFRTVACIKFFSVPPKLVVWGHLKWTQDREE